MSRHSLILVALWCCGLIGGSLRGLDAADGPRPNVLWILSDDLSCDLGCYGQSIVNTPHIDRLASRGVRFDRAYTQYALCNPSRSSFLSGYGPDRTGVIDQDFRARDKLPDAVFLPQLFKQSGYYVAAAGKVHHGGTHIDRPSWDEYNDARGSDARELELAGFRSRNADRTPRWGAAAGEGETTSDGVNTRKMVSYLNQSANLGKPFFLTLGLHKPHVQWVAPQSCIDLYPPANMPRRDWLKGSDVPPIALQTEWPNGSYNVAPAEGLAAYFSCVSFTDRNVGRALEALDRLDLWKDTIVVFMSDHGFHHGDRGLWSKKTLFEQSLHVPLIVVLPDGRNAGRASRRTVQLLDVYPTLADLCGLKAPGDLEGRSLRPLLDDPNAPWGWPARSQVLHEGVMGRSIRTERWRYTEWDGGKAGVELYDHDTDPLELTNLAGRPELAGIARMLSMEIRTAR